MNNFDLLFYLFVFIIVCEIIAQCLEHSFQMIYNPGIIHFCWIPSWINKKTWHFGDTRVYQWGYWNIIVIRK